MFLKGEMDAFMAEALSCRLTLEWLREKNYICVIVESDCLCLVRALQNGTTYPSQVGLILQDGKNILVELSGCSLVHVRRTTNKMLLQKLHLHPVKVCGLSSHPRF